MKKRFIENQKYRRLEKSFSEWLAVLGYAESTVYNLPNLLREFFYFLEQREIYLLEQVHPTLISHYFLYLQNRPNERQMGRLKLSKSHLNKHRQALKKFAQYLQQSQSILLPVSIKALVLEPQKIVILTKNEINLLYKSATNHPTLKWRDLAMLEIYYSCGLRRREGVKLNVKDVDLFKRRLHVRYGKGYKQRLVPFTEQSANRFRDYLKLFRNQIANNNEQALLLSVKGKRINGQSLLLRLKKIQSETKNEILQERQIGLHTLRHSIATHLLESGMSLTYIQQFLGHASLESTQKYTHLKDEF